MNPNLRIGDPNMILKYTGRVKELGQVEFSNQM